MARYEGHWQIRWSSTDLHPHLGEHQTLALRADPPKRASVNEVGGTDVLAPGYLYRYSLDASKAGAFLISTARSVVDALHPFDDTINDPQRLAEQASGTGKPVDSDHAAHRRQQQHRPGPWQHARRGDHPAG